MADRVAATLWEVLDAARAEVEGCDDAFAAGRAFLTLDPDAIEQAPPDGVFAGVTWSKWNRPWETVVTDDDPESGDPAGQIRVVEGDVVVCLWVRTGLDQPGRDDAQFGNDTVGQERYMRLVVGALDGRELFDDAGDRILMRSLTFLGAANKGRGRMSGGWRRTDLQFNCQFRWRLGD